MTSTNPLLELTGLPLFSRIAPADVEPALDVVLAEYRATVERIVGNNAPAAWDTVMAPQEHCENRLNRVWAPVSHLHGVKDSPELRAAYNPALERLTEHATELGQNRALYNAVKAVRESPAFTDLDRARRTLIDDALREFELSGVALEEPARSRFKAIQTGLSKLETAFEEAVLDATDAWTRPVAESELAGLPASARAMLKQAAAEHGVEGYLATLKSPAVVAILTYAENRELRAEIYRAYNTRASDQGPNASQFDNSERIEKILALRDEAAKRLGYENAAQVTLTERMAAMPERVLAFLRDLIARAKPVAERERGELAAFARECLGLDTLQPWDVAFASEKLRQQRFDFSEEDLKPYFPLAAVIEGLFTVAGRVFDIALRPRADVDTWHPDVRYYDLTDASGIVQAGVYLDLYARTGKRGGAWMDVCRARFREENALQPPVAFLTCNFAPETPGQPNLLTHDDVVTLFHEFGHGLHHLLTEVDWPSVGGIAGVEWDAVELPSQFLENFAWDRQALDLFARHYQTGAPLPEDIYRKMLAARHFHAGLFLIRQLEYALFDLRIHLEYDPAQGARTLSLLDDVRREVAVIQPPPWQRFPHTFTHIFSGGYAAGYYSYLWAEVLAADAFAAFEEAGVFDAETGARFRREILAVGGSRPALESFVAFRGREPTPDALLRSYGLTV